jgi:hypothetical protein
MSTQPEDGSDSPEEIPWVPDEVLDRINAEAQASRTQHAAVRTSQSDAELVRRQFIENAPLAAASIVHLAIHSPSEKVRLDASKYVVERTIGKVGEETAGGKDLWEDLLGDIIRNPIGPTDKS